MTNKTRIYNTGKAVTRDELDSLIKDAQIDGDWSKVEQANVSKVTDMSSLFGKINGIKDLNLNGWNTSNVVDMGYMFFDSDYNHPLHFDTSKVEDMRAIFSNSNYNHPLNFDTSNVMNMRYMFFNSDYNHPLNFSVARACHERAWIGYDTSNVKDMRFMFTNSKYNHPLLFDTRNVENMNGIFDNASITHPITFTGGNIPDDIQAFIDETNTAYEEKCKLDNAIQNKRDDTSRNNAIVSSFKL